MGAKKENDISIDMWDRTDETFSSEVKAALSMYVFCSSSSLPQVFGDPVPHFGADGFSSAVNDVDGGGETDAGPLYYDSMRHRKGPSYHI